MRVKYFYNWGLPHPVRYGADTVALNHLAYFRARGWDVELLVPRDPDKDEAAFRAAFPWVAAVTQLDIPRAPAAMREQLWLYEAAAHNPQVRAALSGPADLFFTNYVYTAPLVQALPAGRKAVVETHDLMSEQDRLQAVLALPPNQPVPPILDHHRDFVRRIELDLYRVFDAVVMISRAERDVAAGLGAGNVHYVPQWAAKAEPCGTAPDAEFDLLFFGSDIVPNVRGLHWFYRNVYVPHLWRLGVRFAVAGGVSPAFPQRDHNLTVLGRVGGPVSDLYRRAKVVVSPVFHGSGLSIKMIEALAHGKAVVAAPAAARGLDPAAGAFVVDDMQADPDATARLLTDLLADAGRRRSLELKAAEYAAREFGQAAFLAAMDRVMAAAGLPAPDLRATG